jgi:hypothetical protein
MLSKIRSLLDLGRLVPFNGGKQTAARKRGSNGSQGGQRGPRMSYQPQDLAKIAAQSKILQRQFF